MRHNRSRGMRSVHPHQMVLALDWSAAEVARRSHLRVLPPAEREPAPAPAVAQRVRKAAAA